MKIGDIVSVRFLSFDRRLEGDPRHDVWVKAKVTDLWHDSFQVRFINGEAPEGYETYLLGNYEQNKQWRFEKSM